MLEARGLMVDVAASGIETIDAWLRVPYDLVLMDCLMPEMDGYEATREIRRREGARHTPIVAMTAAALPEDRARCLAAGMDEHMAKPVRASELDLVLTRFVASPAAPDGAATAADALDETRATMGAGFAVLVRQYVADAAASLDAMRDAAERGDSSTIAAVAHRLQGSSGLVGATPIVTICQSLVDDPSEPAARVDELRGEIARLRVRLADDVEAMG
jgi:CheY-like chemotaxis protein